MHGTASIFTALAISFALPVFPAMADDYMARHDKKLESLIKSAVASRMGSIRGPLDNEWREPTAMTMISSMSALDMVAYMYRKERSEVMSASDETPSLAYPVSEFQPRIAFSSMIEMAIPKRPAIASMGNGNMRDFSDPLNIVDKLGPVHSSIRQVSFAAAAELSAAEPVITNTLRLEASGT